jgi:hypothetical protein
VPQIFSQNLQLLLQRDPVKTIAIILSTVDSLSCIPSVGSTAIRLLFSKKVDFWRRSKYHANHLSLLKPIFDKLLVTSASSGEGVSQNKVKWEDLIAARPFASIFFFLIDEAVEILLRLCKDFASRLKDQKAVGNSIIDSQISASFEYIQPLVNELNRRLLESAKFETKLTSQLEFESQLKQTLTKLISTSKYIAENTDICKRQIKEKIDVQVSWVLKPLLATFTAYPALGLHIFDESCYLLNYMDLIESSKPKASEQTLFTKSLYTISKEYLAALKPVVYDVYSYPNHAIEPPYNGISRDWSNQRLVEVLITKFQPKQHSNFWLEASRKSYLTDANKHVVQQNLALQPLLEWIGVEATQKTVLDILKCFYLDADERHRVALKLIEKVKDLDVSDERKRDTLLVSLWGFTDVGHEYVREEIYSRFNKPTIDERLEAIKLLLVATKHTKKTAETLKTFDWLFNRIR